MDKPPAAAAANNAAKPPAAAAANNVANPPAAAAANNVAVLQVVEVVVIAPAANVVVNPAPAANVVVNPPAEAAPPACGAPEVLSLIFLLGILAVAMYWIVLGCLALAK